MKVPNIFVPDKDLTNKINKYLDENKDSEKNSTHIDPNLNYMLHLLGVMLRLEGKSNREIGKYFEEFTKNSEEKRCIYIFDFFKTAEIDLPVNIRQALLEDYFKKEYTRKIKIDIADSYLDSKPSIKDSVMDYVNMIIGLSSENLGPNKVWAYRDPKTGIPKFIKIDMDYIHEVEDQLGLNRTNRESFNHNIIKIYAIKIQSDPYYDFMDNVELVEAVTNVKINLRMSKTMSLIGTLANKTDEENKQVYERVTNNMIKHHGYCNVCVEKTLEHFCTQRE